MVFCMWNKGFNGYEYVNNIKSQHKQIKEEKGVILGVSAMFI